MGSEELLLIESAIFLFVVLYALLNGMWCRPGELAPGPNPPKPDVQVSKHPAFQMILP